MKKCACGHAHHDHEHEHASCGCEHHEHEHHHDHGCSCGHGCGCDHHHDEHAGRTLLIRAGVCVALLALGHVLPVAWLGLVCCIAAYLAAGYDVLLTAARNIRRGRVFDENFLMAVASLGAMAVGESAEGVMVMLLYQLGEYLQHRAVDQSKANIAALMDVRPDYANVLRSGVPVRVSPENVAVGDLIQVRPGEKIPLDGVVVEGHSAVDTAAQTVGQHDNGIVFSLFQHVHVVTAQLFPEFVHTQKANIRK